jgi:diacylglycerol O-acyltransferase
MSEAIDDNKMSDTEALMWRLENDPHLASTFANVTILDRMPDMDRLRRRMERAVQRIPRLQQRVQAAPGNLSPPTWVSDHEFDLNFHIRELALPEPGTERQLFDLATLVMADPFDRTRPLWQFAIVDGLEGGRAALIQKVHHTISDGEGGVQLSLEFLDLERDAPEPISSPDDEHRDRHNQANGAAEDLDVLTADAVRSLLAGGLRLPLGIANRVRELLADPAQIPTASASATETLRDIGSQLGATDKARSPLWTERSLRRRLDVASAPFAETRSAARKLGGSLNTAFLTIASEAASRYHVELGAPVESLRASMAVSTRSEISGANAFTIVRLLVPTGEIPIDERFRSIQEAAQAAIGESQAASLETLATVASTLPSRILTRLARQQTQTVDFATSNVKGSPVAMYVAGARLLHNYPAGPLSGVAFNLTLLSYRGNLDMGINTDAAAITEPELFARSINEAIVDFISA